MWDFLISPDSTAISDPTIRSVADRFLGVGETVFDVMQGTAVNSGYFKRTGSGRDYKTFGKDST